MRLEIKSLHKSYGTTAAIDGVSLTLPENINTLALIGPSGGGKSTLLRLLGGLESPDTGSITIGGKTVTATDQQRRNNGYLFQSYNLFPHLDATTNITLPLEKVHDFTPTAARDRAAQCLDRFGMSAHAAKSPAELSGGQQQRVALARAIAHSPELLILDEPTSALDPEMTSEVLDLIAQLRDEGQSIILSTHEIGFARKIADHAAFLADGKIIEDAPAEEFFANPSSDTLRHFLSKVTRFA